MDCNCPPNTKVRYIIVLLGIVMYCIRRYPARISPLDRLSALLPLSTQLPVPSAAVQPNCSSPRVDRRCVPSEKVTGTNNQLYPLKEEITAMMEQTQQTLMHWAIIGPELASILCLNRIDSGFPMLPYLTRTGPIHCQHHFAPRAGIGNPIGRTTDQHRTT